MLKVNKKRLFKKMGGEAGKYTPLIEAIKDRNVDRVRQLLLDGADANEKDGIEMWSPMKWATYVYKYGPNHNTEVNQNTMHEIVGLLHRYNARNDYDSLLYESSYNFAPLNNDENEELERLRNELEDDDDNEYSEQHNRTSGGKKNKKRTQRKMRKSNKRSKKSHKKVKKTIRRRKHVKK